jgi:phosphatidylserine/phosphatidylglycerophosphate/cardiolipin synthase-like enzyme
MSSHAHVPSGRGRRATLISAGLLIGLLALYLYQVGWIQRALAGPPSPAVDAGGLIKVYFTTPTLIYPDKLWQRPAVPLLQAVLADLDAAREQIDVASFDFDVDELTSALLRARRRGVTVRLIVDSENLLTPEVSEQTGRLQQAGIAVVFDRREPFMHDKIVIVDRAVTWLGSWNITTNDTYRNNNNMLRLVSRRAAADYEHEFEQMFGGRFGTAKTSATPYPSVRVGAAQVAVYFAPQDHVAEHVVARLRAARRSIRFMAFSFTAAAIADAMVERRGAGVLVRGVFETQNAVGRGAVVQRLRDGGVDALLDGNCYILHHKVIIIDERTVITGSYNFTSSAESSNDENLVIVDDPALARAYLDEFDRVYAQAQSPARCQ